MPLAHRTSSCSTWRRWWYQYWVYDDAIWISWGGIASSIPLSKGWKGSPISIVRYRMRAKRVSICFLRLRSRIAGGAIDLSFCRIGSRLDCWLGRCRICLFLGLRSRIIFCILGMKLWVILFEVVFSFSCNLVSLLLYSSLLDLLYKYQKNSIR